VTQAPQPPPVPLEFYLQRFPYGFYDLTLIQL
jgi:hypothetical protein